MFCIKRFLKFKILIVFIYAAVIYLHHSSLLQQRKTNSPSSLTAAQSCVDSRLRTGRCANLATCPQLVEEFYTESRSGAITTDFQSFISDSICGFDGRNFLICCAASLPPAGRPGRFQTAPGGFGATTTYPTLELSLGSLFQFAPLSALSNGSGGVYLTTSTPPMILPSNNPTNTPAVVFQPTTSANNPPVMQLPPPTGQQQPTYNPTPPPVVFNPTPIGSNPTSTPPVVLNPVPPTQPQPVPGPVQPPPSGPIQPPSVVGECGVSRGTTNRVVGGAEARRGSYPWIAALGYYDEFDRNNLKFQCGGSLISQRYILTSAHCVNPSLAVVRLGAHDLSRPLEANSMDFRIKRTVLHEAFDIRSIANDIALLELNTPAPLSTTISTICLPDGANFQTQDFVGMQPFIAGWGAAKHQGATSNLLRDAQVPIVNRQTCEASYKTVFKFIEFSDKLICAGNSNVDACQGDSGGPLMLPTQVNGGSYRYFLLGVVSYGYECARTGFPGVYTRVASYLPWIRANMI